MTDDLALARPMAEAAIAAALDLVVGELEPLAASFLAVDDDRTARFRAALGARRSAERLGRETRDWHRQLAGIEPLAPAVLAGLPGPVATFADLGGARPGLGSAALVDAYRRIGAIDDARLLIRDGRRLRAAIALWRPLRSGPWSAAQLRLLATLQPLIELAYLAALRVEPPLDDLLPATLTPRQREVAQLLVAGANNREVARALNISPNTAKSHTRAVLAKLGAASRREMVVRLRSPGRRLDPPRRQ